MQSKLKPCPFCGGEAERVDIEDGDNAGGSFVHCIVCDASGNVEFEFKENFISNWNRRAPALPDKQAGEVKIKPLKWGFEADDELIAQSVIGWYHIGLPHRAWNLTTPHGDVASFDTLEAAKTAAQSDYEQRIRSALVDVPAEPVAHLRPCGLTYLSGEKRDGLIVADRNHPKSFAVYTRPPLSRQGEDSAEVTRRFSLEWIAGARPPVHPNPMLGRQSFRSIDEAIAFMGRQAEDAQFVSMTEYEEREFDRSEEARTALAATRSGSASTASGTSPIRQRGESDGR